MSTVHPGYSGGLLEPRFETLAELVQAVTGSLDLSDALDRVAPDATRLIPYSPHASVWANTIGYLRAEAGTRGRPAWSHTELAIWRGLYFQAPHPRKRGVSGQERAVRSTGQQRDWTRARLRVFRDPPLLVPGAIGRCDLRRASHELRPCLKLLRLSAVKRPSPYRMLGSTPKRHAVVAPTKHWSMSPAHLPPSASRTGRPIADRVGSASGPSPPPTARPYSVLHLLAASGTRGPA